MSKTETDSRFFTNSDSDSLYSRFSVTLKDAEFFDVLVGYFRTSGFYRMYRELEDVKKIRILIGLNIDKKGFELLEAAKKKVFYSHEHCVKEFQKTLKNEMDDSEDSYEVEIAAEKFVEFINNGKLELKVHPSRNIHAKVYVTRFKEEDRDFGRVITGSSNFSENGLVAQREFNVELKDKSDVDFALERFEELWEEGIDVSEEYVKTIETETWKKINHPYEVYLKFLYEYFQEEINTDKTNIDSPENFMDLNYQKQAVVQAKRILEEYNGVFLADVVGLGKTYMTSMLLTQFSGKKLIICPPVLIEYWEDTLRNFNVSGYKVESLGKIDALLEKGVEDYKYVVIDEAHRFRNQMTGRYESLHRVCFNKKVILVSATPLNNKLEDINAQIGLFQPRKNSSIPNLKDLDGFFSAQQRAIDKCEKGSQEHLAQMKRAAVNVREKVLQYVMVRRTRSEIIKYFDKDMKNKKLFFPEIVAPKKVVYQFSDDTEKVFNETIKLLKQLSYARYTPLLSLKIPLSDFDAQAQHNLGGFVKSILVKRLESSFFAFGKTLGRFISSYEKFKNMYDAGTVWISKNVDVFDLIDQDNEEKLEQLLTEGRADKYQSNAFRDEFRDKLEQDLSILCAIRDLWKKVEDDPKVESFIQQLKENEILVGKKVLIFTESKETATYIQSKLDEQFPNKVLSYSSQGGVYQKESFSQGKLSKIVEQNYDPNNNQQSDDVQILITTDVLAEGTNLHRANIVINYDLPWNPTRVLQRVGRVNRVGTQHEKIYIFNFFPTAQADAHLGLENNIKGKLQAFHSVMGEDAQYLSEDEDVSAHGLFERFNSVEEDEGAINPEAPYLHEIRKIRDDSPELFEKIKNLPKKARAGRAAAGDLAAKKDSVLTFFRQGILRQFAISDEGNSNELYFEEAAKLFKCDPNTKSEAFDVKTYHKLLQMNKDHLEVLASEDENISTGGSRSNETQLLKTLQAVNNEQKYTETDESYIKTVRTAVEEGRMPRQTIKSIWGELKNNKEPFHVLDVLNKYIRPEYIQTEEEKAATMQSRQIVLSSYLIGGKNEGK